MARNFDGTDDNINFGSDATVDDFATKTLMLWLNPNVPASNYDIFVAKNGSGDTGWQLGISTFANVIGWYHTFSGGAGSWVFTRPTNGTPIHIAITYDNTSTTNDPVIEVDGVAQTLTEDLTPSGTANGDATYSLRLGENDLGGQDAQGVIQCLVYDSTIVAADRRNRHRWWGRPGGAVAVLHPLLTDKVTNEGTATANGTVTGSTMTTISKVQRAGAGMLGMIGL